MTKFKFPLVIPKTFQLTSSRRGWHSSEVWILTVWVYFNSHPHEEDDVSIQADGGLLVNFNSHPHEEDDRGILGGYRGIWVFQLTSSRRGWHYETDYGSDRLTFQLTSSRRGWPCGTYNIGGQEAISTHILTKRMTGLKILSWFPQIFQLTSSRRGWREK